MAKLKPMVTKKEWLALKKKYKVPDGAVSGVQIAKGIEEYWAKSQQSMQRAALLNNITLLDKLEKTFATYISKFPKDKIKDYPKFQKEFLDNYVNMARALKEDFKRYAADGATYTKELISFFSMVQKLEIDKSTKTDLEAFKSGPMRGLSAVGSSLKGFDLSKIDSECAPINTAIDKLGDADRNKLNSVIKDIFKAAKNIQKAAKEVGLA